ncbi:MAG: B12-binding domain-containing radical SAM protein [Bacillota bacterium]
MKLGFIAMSGVRAHNKKLVELGLTLPGFVERSKVIASLPSLGLLTLAGMTPRDIEVAYVEVPDVDAIDGVPGDFDAVAISSFSAQIREAYRLAGRYRERGTRVILGGLHVTARPQEALEHADAIVIGEGEPSWPSVARDLQRGTLQAIYDSRSTPFSLADSPMPRFDLLDVERYNRLTVQTQRGCPFRCEFCAASIRISPTYKTKPVAKVIDEIRRIREIWPHPFIEFADDNTFVNKRHGGELVRALAKEHVRWFTETDISVAEDEDLLALMRDAGCAQVLVGLESPSSAELNGLEQKANWKAKQRPKYLEAIDRIQRNGITVNGCFVLGLDGADTGSFDEIFDFVRDSGLYEVQVTVQTAFPGTPLYERARREGRVLRDDAWELCTLFDVNLKPAQMSVSELEAGLLSLTERLYKDEFVKERRARFFDRRRAYVREMAIPMEAQA